MFRLFLLVTLLAIGACSSTHDLKRDGTNIFGGGFIDDKIGPGLYLIKAFSNTSFFATHESAAETFEYRAMQLCPNGYEELRVISDAYESMTPGPTVPVPGFPGVAVSGPKQVITSKIGHVRCRDAPITYKEAKALVGS